MANSTFIFVRIPANEADPIEEITEDKSGGLENDKLILHAKEFFATTMADITALTVPTAENDYTACSLYATTNHSPDSNTRATNLLTACGYGTPSSPIAGDVFVGRCRDNEEADVWERLDFTIADADPAAPWCRAARSSATRPKTAASLQGLLQTQLGGSGGDGAPATVIQAGDQDASQNAYGQNNHAVQESWGKWAQANEEIEVMLPVEGTIKTKDCKVVLKRNQVSVQVGGMEQLAGSTFDPIDTDESTFTFQTENDQRYLVLHLAKSNPGATWTFAIR